MKADSVRQTLDQTLEQLLGECERILVGQQGQQVAERYGRRLSDLDASLGKLEAALKIHRRVRRATGVIGLPDLEAVTKAYKSRTGSRDGLPHFNSLNAAISSVDNTAAGLTAHAERAWKEWAPQQAAKVNERALRLLPPGQRDFMLGQFTKVRRIAKITSPSSAEVGEFIQALAAINEHTASTAETGSEVEAVLARIDIGGGVSLAEVSAVELSALRSHPVAEELWVSWRPSS